MFFQFVLAAIVALSPAFVSPQLPDTPAGKMLGAWLAAFNSGDRETYRQFAEKNYPAGLKNLDRLLAFRAMTGGFDLAKIEEASNSKVSALVQERDSDQFGRLILEVDATEMHAMSGVKIMAIPRPAEFALPHLSQNDLLTQVASRAEKASANDRFSGAVLVAKDGKPIFARAYGLADRERKIPNTLDTRFRVGSMNKMFTAVATLQLVAAGRLKLTDSVGTYLKDYPNKDIAAKVTIHQLLTHTGGTGDLFGPEFEAHRLELRTVQDYINLYGARAPGFEPGTKYAYSNYGFILLGAIIEKVSGESYYDYVHQHIYVPAGMTSTDSEPESTMVSNRSIGYVKDEGSWKANTDTLPYRGLPAGGGYSTVSDFLKFANALQQYKLLDAHYLELLTTVPADAKDANYAYGFGSFDINGTRCYGHSGGAPGMNGDLQICPAAGYVVVVLANEDPPAATGLSTFIVNRLPAAK